MTRQVPYLLALASHQSLIAACSIRRQAFPYATLWQVFRYVNELYTPLKTLTPHLSEDPLLSPAQKFRQELECWRFVSEKGFSLLPHDSEATRGTER